MVLINGLDAPQINRNANSSLGFKHRHKYCDVNY
jgi:hypothetical protein